VVSGEVPHPHDNAFFFAIKFGSGGGSGMAQWGNAVSEHGVRLLRPFSAAIRANLLRTLGFVSKVKGTMLGTLVVDVTVAGRGAKMDASDVLCHCCSQPWCTAIVKSHTSSDAFLPRFPCVYKVHSYDSDVIQNKSLISGIHFHFNCRCTD